MATLSIGKADITVGTLGNNQPAEVNGKGESILARLSNFASSAQQVADKSDRYAHDQTERMMFHL